MEDKPKRRTPQATRKKIAKALKNRKRPPEVRAKISETKRNQKFTDEHKKNISKAKKGSTTFTDEQRRRMSEAHKGKRQTPETLRKRSESMKKRWAERKAQGLPWKRNQMATLVAFLLIGCSLKFNSVSPIPLDIDALLGASAEDFDFRLKGMADAQLVSEARWEADKIPTDYTGAKQDLVGTVRRRFYEIVLADTARRPRVNVSFHYTDARARRIRIDFDRYVRKLDALEWLGFDIESLYEFGGEYTWEAHTEGRRWLIYQVGDDLDITYVPSQGKELCFIHWWEHNLGRETFVSVRLRSR